MQETRRKRSIPSQPLQNRPKGKPKDRWKNEGENEVRVGIVNWKQVAQDGDGWRRATGEALVLLG